MRYKYTDILILLILLSLPLFGVLQACGGGDPAAPRLPGDTPPPDNHPPVAVISVVSPEEGPTPFTVELDASDSFDPDGDEIEFQWLFSDDTSDLGPTTEHEFIKSGRHEVRLVVTDKWGASDDAGPITIYGWGLANSPWPKFAHDERNSGVSPNIGPMMDLENADEGGAFPRYWRSGIENDKVTAVCIGYDGMVIYTQGSWLRARTADGGWLWDVEAESEITAWPAIAHDGSIILGTRAGWMHRVDSDGEVIWSNNTAATEGNPLLGPSVNIGHDGTIYVASCKEFDLHDSTGKLLAFSMEGDLKWSYHVPQCLIESHGSVSSIIPALTPSGDIVLNGRPGFILSPGGELIAVLEYFYAYSSSQLHSLGPPSVNVDGLIAFSHNQCPVFYSDGSFHTELFDKGITNFECSPVWGQFGVSQVATSQGWDEYLFFVNTRADGGTLTSVTFKTIPYGNCVITDQDWVIQGESQDAVGKLYISCLGLHAVSPLSYHSIYPHVPERYSLWSYERPLSSYMTAPVIGEDGWLYVGYGNDILAIGD